MGQSGGVGGFDDCFKIYRSATGSTKNGYLFNADTVRDKRLMVESVCFLHQHHHHNNLHHHRFHRRLRWLLVLQILQLKQHALHDLS